MLELYHKTSWGCSKLITRTYTTSFSLAISTLDRKFHDPVYGVYGFVRLADEVVDTFHNYDKISLLDNLRKDTDEAIKNRISTNPVLHSFQQVVHKYNITEDLINAFFRSMEMDIYKDVYDQAMYKEYVYGSAEVVGLMCLKIFTEGDQEKYNALTHSARRLGSAFQKVNFLRDIKADYVERGRTYFPGIDPAFLNDDSKKQIEKEITEDFLAAYDGIKGLPKGARAGVYLAYIYYMALFKKIKKVHPGKILRQRIRIRDNRKLMLLIGSYIKNSINAI